MRDVLPFGGVPGASVAAEGVRALRRSRRRRRISSLLAASAVVLLATGLVQRSVALLMSASAVAVAAWCLRPDRDPRRWDRAAAGEVATAALLRRLPASFEVLHDRRPPGTRGNIDHVVVGPSGVWVVDTKVRSARLQIRGGQVWAGWYPIDVEPAARQASRLAAVLNVAVRPVVAVHGHGLRRRGKKVAGVLVLPAPRLARRIGRLRRLGWRKRRLSRSTVAALATTVDRNFPPAARPERSGAQGGASLARGSARR